MQLRMPTPAQLAAVYNADLVPSFPAAELKPLRAIQEMWREGWYHPWCLFDGDDIAGECFLWLGRPGWMLLDYLCVSPRRRNSGTGALLLSKMLETERESVILAESEAPCHAPDPALARRRRAFMPATPPALRAMTQRCSAHTTKRFIGRRENFPTGS